MNEKKIINLFNEVDPDNISKAQLENDLPTKLLKKIGKKTILKAQKENNKDSKPLNNHFIIHHKIIIATVLIFIVTISAIILLPLKSSKAIAIPNYPAKTNFNHSNSNNNPEIIDNNFLNKLGDFSFKSSSIILSEKNKQKNELYSPISLYMTLALSADSAKGETRNEILKALSMDDIDISSIRQQSGKLFRALYTNNEIGRLNIANSIWLDKNVNFNKIFLKNAAENYYTHSFSVDFKSTNANKMISKWISDNTNGKLQINSPQNISPNQIMSIINTVYFHDQWVDKFDSSKTAKDKFYISKNNSVTCNFMNMTYPSHGFIKKDGYTVSYLSFKNRKSMIFILPDEGVSPYDLIKNPRTFSDAVNALKSKDTQDGKVVFKIPKFKFGTQLDLSNELKKLGLQRAFVINKADFSNLTGSKSVYISNIKQSTSISINEIGCEAAAYTQTEYDSASKPNGHADMIMNRPFIFAITGEDKAPLFIGVINNPNAR